MYCNKYTQKDNFFNDIKIAEYPLFSYKIQFFQRRDFYFVP